MEESHSSVLICIPLNSSTLHFCPPIFYPVTFLFCQFVTSLGFVFKYQPLSVLEATIFLSEYQFSPSSNP